MALLTAGCDLGYRSVAEFHGEVVLAPGIERVRIEVQEGSVGIASQEGRSVTFAAGVRRAGNTAEELAALEAVSLEVTSAIDPSDPKTLVVTCPRPKSDQLGIFGLDLSFKLPAELAVDVRIAGSGHFVTADRRGEVRIETRRGDLRFSDCRGVLHARSGQGNVIVNNHSGDIDLRVGVGDIQVFCRQPADLLRLTTGEGTIQCYVPPNTDFEVDARAEIGLVKNAFGLEAQTVQTYSSVLKGTQGSGRTKIALSTGKGHVALLQKTWS